ncbi:conserved hypothetical protein [Neospora caninum Liverpool]|uniref:EGF-like domain-containing protein n=1 Tax=Neospora caninum (strain Liverpool) TaxID=572307 RepID=F0VJH3_NEOCL|nr:conserved hypothetical protein [Neospora caninum Liverpool]CBZ53884.1 conserved hypothetical protein [Neospora caninum Liverpool]|eukprot:XP_003883916.1 conserved hypothetical protein [Neospora caninum Liverpool]
MQHFSRSRSSPRWIPKTARLVLFWHYLFLLSLLFSVCSAATVVAHRSNQITRLLRAKEREGRRWRAGEGEKGRGGFAWAGQCALREDIENVGSCSLLEESTETELPFPSSFPLSSRFSSASASLLRITNSREKKAKRMWIRKRQGRTNPCTCLDRGQASLLPASTPSSSPSIPSPSSPDASLGSRPSPEPPSTLIAPQRLLASSPSFSSSQLSFSSLASSFSSVSPSMPAAVSQRRQDAAQGRRGEPGSVRSPPSRLSLSTFVLSSWPTPSFNKWLSSFFPFFSDLPSSPSSSSSSLCSLLSPFWALHGLPVLLFGSAATPLENPRKDRREKEVGRERRGRRGHEEKQSNGLGEGNRVARPFQEKALAAAGGFGGVSATLSTADVLPSHISSALSFPPLERKGCHSSCLSCSRPNAQNACRSCPNQISSPSEVFAFFSSFPASASSPSLSPSSSPPGASIFPFAPDLSGSSAFLSPSSFSALSVPFLRSLPHILTPLFQDGSGLCIPVAPGDSSPSAADVCLGVDSEENPAVSCNFSSHSPLPEADGPPSSVSSSCSLSSMSSSSAPSSFSPASPSLPCSFSGSGDRPLRDEGARGDTEQRLGEEEREKNLERKKAKERLKDHCHPSCLTCRADCCYRKADNCLSCNLTFSSLRRLYPDGTGRCLSIRKREDESTSVEPTSSGGREDAGEPSGGYGAIGDWFQALIGFADVQPSWEIIAGHPSLSAVSPPYSPPPSSSPISISTSSTTPSPTSSPSSLPSSFSSSYSSSPSSSSSSSSSSLPSSSSSPPPLLASFTASPFALPPPSASSICRSLPSAASALPLLHFLHLFFLHADNNLEESALLDMEEILNPYIGRRALNAILAAQNSGLSGGGTPGGAASQAPTPLAPHLALAQMYIVTLLDRPKSGSPSKATEASIGRVHICGNLEYTQKGNIRVRGNQTIFVQEGWQGTAELSSETAYELLRVKNEDGRFEWMLLRDLGEMNSPSVLASFLQRNLDLFPARHAALTLWNHGSAWVGFGDDESNADNSPMSLKELVQGLQKGLRGSARGKHDPAFKFSVLGFDACLMASYDVLEAVAPFAHFVIASEDNEPGHGWNYHLTDPTTLLDNADASAPQSLPPPSRREFFSSAPSPAALPPSLASLSAAPSPFRLSTAYEYASRFIASYALHPRSSVALTLSLIEVKTFLTFKHKFEEVMDHLFACGGSAISSVIRRALAASFTIRGCEMVSLCSCFDLFDFLDHLLRLLTAQRHQVYSSLPSPSSLSSYSSANAAPLSSKRAAPLLSVAEKVASLRRMLKAMVVMEVGTREEGRYAGLSMYFPDPNMQLNCKNTRGASLWAEQYHRSVQSRYAAFVTSVQKNQRGSVCYFSSTLASSPASSIGASPHPAEEAEEERFEVLEARLLGGKRQGGHHLVGLAAIAPASLMFALMFRGFVSSVHGNGRSAPPAARPQPQREEQSPMQRREGNLASSSASSSFLESSSTPPPTPQIGVSTAKEERKERGRGTFHIVVEVFSTLQASMTDITDVDWLGTLPEEQEEQQEEGREEEREEEREGSRSSGATKRGTPGKREDSAPEAGKRKNHPENSRERFGRHGETEAEREDSESEGKKTPGGEETAGRNERQDAKRTPGTAEAAFSSFSASPKERKGRKGANTEQHKVDPPRRKPENLSVAESWWDERVWLLRQQRAVLPSFKDPRRRPLAMQRRRTREETEDEADEGQTDREDEREEEGQGEYLESLLIAMQDVPESPSRRNTEERRIFTFPFIFYEDAAALECAQRAMRSTFAHPNSASRSSLAAQSVSPSPSASGEGTPYTDASASKSSALPSQLASSPREALAAAAAQTRVLTARRLAEEEEEQRTVKEETKDEMAEEDGIPFGSVDTSRSRPSSAWLSGRSGESKRKREIEHEGTEGTFFTRPLVISSETLFSLPSSGGETAARRHLQSRRGETHDSSAASSSSSPHALPAAFGGALGQREDGRACGERAYLLGEMEGDRVSKLTLYVVVNNMPNERPQSSGGILQPIRKTFTFEHHQPRLGLAFASSSSSAERQGRRLSETDDEEQREAWLKEQLAAALREEREGHTFIASVGRGTDQWQTGDRRRQEEGKEGTDEGKKQETNSAAAPNRDKERTDQWLENEQSGKKKEGGKEDKQGEERRDGEATSSERAAQRKRRGDEQGNTETVRWSKITMEELTQDVLFLWGEKEDVGELEIVSVSRGAYARMQKERQTDGKKGTTENKQQREEARHARTKDEGDSEDAHRADIREEEDNLPEIDSRHVLGFVMQSVTEQRGGFLLSLPSPKDETPPSSFSFFSSLFSFGEGEEQKKKEDDCQPAWIGDGICDPPCDRPEFSADGGDCPHRSRLGRLWLDQQQPTGPCINNQCGLNAICEETPVPSNVTLSLSGLPSQSRLFYFEKEVETEPASASSVSPSSDSPHSSSFSALASVSAPSFASSVPSHFSSSRERGSSSATTGKTGSERKQSVQESAAENQAPPRAPATSTVWFTPQGAYRCRCKIGYEGDGLNCRDVDECAAGATSPCHPAALCINTKGSFRCVCKAHYVGDGISFCMPQSEVAQGDTLSDLEHRRCVDRDGKPLCPSTLHCLPDGSCGCNEGYVQTTEDTCEDIDECEEGLASCAPSALALCINTEGGYFCSCREGYEGDGRQCVKGPSVLHARLVVSVDLRQTMEKEGGVEEFTRLFRDSVAEAVPTLTRERIEVLSVSDGSVSILLRIHPSPFSSRKKPPFATREAGSEEGTRERGEMESAFTMEEGKDRRFVREDEPPLTSAEILLALQCQLEDPTSPLRTGPFGEYAAVSSLEEYHFLTKAQAYGTHDVLDLLTKWLPTWITDHVPKSIIVGMELCFFVVMFLILLNCLIKICKRKKKRRLSILFPLLPPPPLFFQLGHKARPGVTDRGKNEEDAVFQETARKEDEMKTRSRK